MKDYIFTSFSLSLIVWNSSCKTRDFDPKLRSFPFDWCLIWNVAWKVGSFWWKRVCRRRSQTWRARRWLWRACSTRRAWWRTSTSGGGEAGDRRRQDQGGGATGGGEEGRTRRTRRAAGRRRRKRRRRRARRKKHSGRADGSWFAVGAVSPSKSSTMLGGGSTGYSAWMWS